MLRYCQHAKVPEDCAEDLKATVSRKREALMERILNEQGLDATSEEHRPLMDIMGELDTWRENYARIKNANPLPFWFYDWLDEDQQAEFFAQMTSFDWAIKKSEQLEEAQD
ncbi:hypothetical protein DZK27_04600 [Rhodobacteraceae bacterium 63075]|nr:hypothetical protein DZK27_04600 [Rhodobacteraceae bacterium 63075]